MAEGGGPSGTGHGRKRQLDDAEAILILGAAVWAEGPSPTLRRRGLHGAALARAMPERPVVLCGGTGRFAPSEAEALRDLLVAEGIAPDRLHLEDRSTNTIGNIRNALPILRRLGLSRVCLVTDSTHAPRARMIARHFGLAARSDCPRWTQGRKSHHAKQALREALAVPVTLWRLRRLPPPDEIR